jgi:predicted outer membrane repeat protein
LNIAQKNGGAIYLQSNVKISFTATQFIGNSALQNGGAIYSDATSFELIQSKFPFNSALQGGAIYSQAFAFSSNSSANNFVKNSAVYFGDFGCNSPLGSGGALF